MKKLNGTVTLSILEEDNSQRVIFRIIPLCTKDGLIFLDRKTNYPDFGSLRIIPDKREQSSFKERMCAIGSLCCVQLYSDIKEMTKIRQNRNYDPNQGEFNQYAIYSDVICGFEQEAIFEVFQEEQDSATALIESVLVQRGKVLYGPVKKGGEVRWDALKPYGNENYLLHTVEDPEGKMRTYYWNPDAVVTWRQRKKAMKRVAEPVKELETKPNESVVEPAPQAPKEAQEQIPIGTKLEILDDQLTTEEHISELNLPISADANLLENAVKQPAAEAPVEAPHFHGTPIAESPKNGAHEKLRDCYMHGVVEKQLKERQSAEAAAKTGRKPVENPIENLRAALLDVWQIPALHQEFIRVLGENKEMTRAILLSPLMDGQAKSAYSAAKAELDAIEAERISLLVELDKVKSDYQQTKERMYAELAKQKQAEISAMEKRLFELKEECKALEEILSQLGDQVQKGINGLLANKGSALISTNGSDLTISPTLGFHFETKEITEVVRSMMSDIGFLCKQDCVTEFLIFLSLYDEVCVYAAQLWEAELYVKNVLRALGLLNVAAWPGVFGTLRILSLLPENDLRTPTIEVIKNNRIPLKAYGHKTIRLIDGNYLKEVGALPVIRVPQLNKERGQEKLNVSGKPISQQTIHAFCKSSELLHKDGEAWFDTLEKKLAAEEIEVSAEICHAMRVFARVTAPQVVGGFIEAADAAALAWIVPLLVIRKHPKARLAELIGDLPRCMYVMNEEKY